jgi:predicted nucleotidyltransferase component of viral defense system
LFDDFGVGLNHAPLWSLLKSYGKGGTALNFFYLNLTRLSVDTDLNYIGHIDREATLRDRPEIVKAVEQIVYATAPAVAGA